MDIFIAFSPFVPLKLCFCNFLCEPGIKIPKQKDIEGLRINLFNQKNVFFGGVNAVSKSEAVGDTRRGGYGIIV